MASRLNVLQIDIYKIVVKLMQLRENGIQLFYGGKYEKICSLQSEGKELLMIDNIDYKLIDCFSPKTLESICDKAGFCLPPLGSKCSIIINGKNFYIRSMHHSDRPLVNHSTRDKYLAVCEKLGLSFFPFDKAVNEYWRKRMLGVINEDVQNSSDYSPFADLKDELSPILTYMAFTSSLKQNNGEYNADYILDYEISSDISTWHIYDRSNYIETIWPYLRFSFRADRGMPKSYNPENKKFELIHPWVHFWNGQYKGALHIRIVAFNSNNPRAPKLLTKYKDVIETVKKNKGERDELIIKFFFIEARMKGLYLPINEQNTKIIKVGSSPIKDYKDLPFQLIWNELSAPEIISLANMCEINKAGKFDKADIFVNNIGISIKSQRGAAPTIINQTVRTGILRVMKHLNQSIIPLDNMVNRYWNLRLNGIISEDIRVIDDNSPFMNDGSTDGYSYLQPLLTYFAFDGTGTKDSDNPAELILEFKEPLNQKTWTYYSKESYIKSVWDRLVFSIRGKGLVDKNKKAKNNIPWIRSVDGKEKGTLNVRIKK